MDLFTAGSAFRFCEEKNGFRHFSIQQQQQNQLHGIQIDLHFSYVCLVRGKKCEKETNPFII